MAETSVGTAVTAEIIPPFLATANLDPYLPDDLMTWPTEDDLPCEDDEPMETPRHRRQMEVLIQSLELHWADRKNWYIGGNMFVYFSPNQVKTEDYRGPDFFAVQGVEDRDRKSYVVWQEEKAPDVIIELLSDKTREFDKKQKKRIYQDKLRVPEYYWFDPYSYEWAGFRLVGSVYQPIEPDEQGRLICEVFGLALIQREGRFGSFGGTWLRWATLDGELLLTPQELADIAQREAEAAQREAEAAQREAEAAQREAENARQRTGELEALLAKYQQQFGALAE
ncbi:MAG: Uma2 family endonuclease [Acidobacteriota bacterium]